METCDCIKTGLVLEGGAMRGMYTSAILDLFIEKNVNFSEVVGVSAGALFGVNYLSRQPGRALGYNKIFVTNPEYMGLLPLLKEGNIVSTEIAYQDIPEKIYPFDNQRFRASGIPFFAVTTDVETGKPKYFEIRDVFAQMDTLRASGSMPFVSREVEIHGRRFLDGGISDPIPYRFMRESRHCQKTVVILTRDISYRKTGMNAQLLKVYEKKQPGMARAMKMRHIRYNRQLDELRALEEQGEVFVIRPSEPIRIRRIEKDPEKLQAVYDLGRKDGEACMEALLRYLES